MPSEPSLLEALLPLVLLVPAMVATLWIDRRTEALGQTPPGFLQPGRRLVVFSALAFVFWLTIFLPLLSLGEVPEFDPEKVSFAAVFLVQALLFAVLVLWYTLGFGFGAGAGPVEENPQKAWPRILQELGLPRVDWRQELGVGLVAGVLAWGLVLMAAMLLGAIFLVLGGDSWIEQEPPGAIVWLAGLPVGHRLLVSLSAGVFEEIFFRGFLQGRIGIFAATLFFIAGHAGYGQPFMFFGLAILSTIYGLLTWWRGSVWAAIVAHFVFDAIQLLVVIPWSLQMMATPPAEGSLALAWIC